MASPRKDPSRWKIGLHWTAAAWRVLVELKSHSAKLFGRLTANNVHRRLVIIVDDMVLSAPIIQEEIPGGTLAISMGGGQHAQAEKLAAQVSSGPLPELIPMNETIVGPAAP